jgi:hypothetical protein
MVSIYLYNLLLLASDDMPYREECGWVLLSTIFLSCGVNILKFLHLAGTAIWRKLPKCNAEEPII